jgi:hypothetical protein
MARAETKGIGRACVRRDVNHHAPLATKSKKWEAALSWINRGIDSVIDAINSHCKLLPTEPADIGQILPREESRVRRGRGFRVYRPAVRRR